MYTDRLLITENWSEIRQAEKLGLSIPKSKTVKTKFLFWKKNVSKVILDAENGNILIEFNDESSHELEFDQKLWDELQEFFMENEE